MFFAEMANLFVPALTFEPPHIREARIGEAHTFGIAQNLGRNRFHGMLLELQLHVVNFLQLVQERGIDGGDLRALLDGVALMQRVTYVAEPLLLWSHEAVREN